MRKDIFMLSVYVIIENQYDDHYTYFSLSREDAEDAKAEILASYKKNDGSYIRGISSVDVDIDRISFEEAKDIMTVSQFEALYKRKVDDLIG